MSHLAGSWGSILPPNSVPPVAYNGLCECRGRLNLHPFHYGSTMTLEIKCQPAEYVGKHRKPE